MKPEFKNLNKQQVREISDKTSAFAFDNAENGKIVFLSDDKRRRGGKYDYKQYVEKVGGAIELAEPSGATGGGKGGLLWVDPDSTQTNRSRVIYALNSVVYMWDITTGTNYLLRDIGTVDTGTIAFLSGFQDKSVAAFVIGDSTMTAVQWHYTGTSNGAITAFADYSGTVAGTVLVTDVAHGMQTGNTVTIRGTTNYNGTYTIARVDADNFYITAAWVADDATGTWTGETLTKVDATGQLAGRLAFTLDNRAVVTGTGDKNDQGQYSEVETDGVFDEFTAGTLPDEAGVLSGVKSEIVAGYKFKGVGYVFERETITPHLITNYDVSGSGRVKDTKTIVQEHVIDGVGVESPKAVTSDNNNMYFVNRKGLFAWNPADGLRELTKGYRPLMKSFTFTKASIAINTETNELIITCATEDGIGQDFNLIYSLDGGSLSFVPNRFYNQLMFDPIGKKMYATSSTTPRLLEVYKEDSYADEEDEKVDLAAETRMYDMDIPDKYKSFCDISCQVGGVTDTQSFLFEIFVDEQEDPYTSFTRSMADVISLTGGGGSAWGNDAWGAGVVGQPNEMTFVDISWNGFVPQFGKISLRVTESSPFRSAVNQPIIRWKATNTKLNSFSSTS